jgi:cyclopropane fatty-acyl-phospholipid synthase-like methyltransferase
MDNKDYWEKYYKNNKNPVVPSSFAEFCVGFLDKDKTLIELGCGNGRDSLFFSKNEINVVAIDQVENEIKYLNEKFSSDKLKFLSDDFTALPTDKTYDYVYSRFTLHSITNEKEEDVLNWVSSQLNENGLFLLEVRSLNDPMLNKGEKISKNENVTNHYRRYLDFDETIDKIQSKGLNIIYKLESQGLSVYKTDDPMLIRIVAKKE